MSLLDVLSPVVSLLAVFAVIAAVSSSYVLFATFRRLSSALAGAAGGIAVGALFGVGVPVLAGAAGGALLGFVLADVHPRGGSVAVALGAGVSLGSVFVAGASGSPAIRQPLLVGVGLAAVLIAVAWRFPRGVVLPGLSGALGCLITVGLLDGGASLTAVRSGTIVGASPYASDGAVVALIGPLTFLLFGAVMQPFLLEYTDRVPPLLPSWLRGLVGATDAGQGVPDEVRPPCPECGTIRDPGHGVCRSCGATTDADYSIPDGVVAVDVPCPHCGERPVEESAAAYRATGLLLAYRIHTERVVGCHACVRRECWSAAKVTAVTGWWSVSCLLVNPFLIAQNVVRGLYDRGPSRSLLGTLEDAGIEYEFLEDRSEFDPDDHGAASMVAEGLVRLGAAVMMADGDADREEARRIRDAVLELTDAYAASEVQSMIEDAARERPDVDAVVEGLAGTLTLEGRQAALDLAVDVATADGTVTDEEEDTVAEIAEGLEVDDPESVAVEQYVDPAA